MNAAARASGGAVPAVWSSDSRLVDHPDDSAERFAETRDSWSRFEWVGLTGRARWKRGKKYLQTREPGIWIRASDATVVAGSRPIGIALAPGDKWIDVSIHRGTLVAYEGERPVFATLVSPGLLGYKRVNGKPAKNVTPTGVYRIEWKHLSTTMSPDPESMSYYLSEVPFTQFFHMPFALHGVYWHGEFGEPKSGGCVNLSVSDAKWLFDWTAPALPYGWHSVRSGEGRGAGTWVRIR
ncbi:MAG: L,D-transpeptidase [Polyangiaceae bacterium]|nr:L,D-transpeptidase [Polyangiaceae bacterium]